MRQEDFNLLLDKLTEVQVTMAELNLKWQIYNESAEKVKKDVEELKAFSNKAKGVLAFILAASSIAAAKALIFTK